MSITALNHPDQYTPNANGAPFVFSGSNATSQGFNFVVDVYVDDAWIARDTIAPEPLTGFGLYDAKSKVSSRLAQDPITASTIYSITAADLPYCKYALSLGESNSYLVFSSITDSGGGLLTFGCLSPHGFGAGSSVYIIPQADDAADDFSGSRSVVTAATTTSFAISGSFSVVPSNLTGRVRYANGDPIIHSAVTSFSNYWMFKSAHKRNEFFSYTSADWRAGTSSTAKFLTDMPRDGWNFRTNGRLWLFSHFNTNAYLVDLFTKNETGGTIGEYYFTNPITGVTSACFFRGGPQDLADASGFTVHSGPASIISDDVKSVSFWWTDSLRVRVSEIITYRIDRRCYTDEQPTSLLFLDQKGSYVSAILQSRRQVKRKISKQTFKRQDFSLITASPFYNTDKSQRQHTTYGVDMEEKFMAEAFLASQSDVEFLSELFMSTDVWEIQSDGSLVPVTVNESEVDLATLQMTRGNPIKIPVGYSYGFDQPLNV